MIIENYRFPSLINHLIICFFTLAKKQRAVKYLRVSNYSFPCDGGWGGGRGDLGSPFVPIIPRVSDCYFPCDGGGGGRGGNLGSPFVPIILRVSNCSFPCDGGGGGAGWDLGSSFVPIILRVSDCYFPWGIWGYILSPTILGEC